MPVDFSLTDKVAVITGASRGIGEAIARTFAGQGARVVISSRKQDACDKVVESIKQGGGEAMAQACHTGKMDQIEALYEKVMDAYGTVDILVNNAATNPYFGDLLNISESQYDKTFDVNTKGYFFMAQKACKIMLEKKGGSVINIASIAGIKAPPMQGVYGMTKASVILLTKALAAELGPFGIRVNCICPGLTDTYFSSVLIKTKPIYDAAMTMIPLKRHAQPDEMAGAALYLASQASSFTTGSVIVCDGGAVA
jgi:NAD(P)-dependent dehydrogenase (short-subunit alcohol dehydrogenase family)